jgi:hypothetical protein
MALVKDVTIRLCGSSNVGQWVCIRGPREVEGRDCMVVRVTRHDGTQAQAQNTSTCMILLYHSPSLKLLITDELLITYDLLRTDDLDALPLTDDWRYNLGIVGALIC